MQDFYHQQYGCGLYSSQSLQNPPTKASTLFLLGVPSIIYGIYSLRIKEIQGVLESWVSRC